MYKPTRLFLLILFLAVTQLSSVAQSQSVSIGDLAKKADVILTGKVSEQSSSWNENKSRIFTKTTLRVQEYLKGSNSVSVVEITSPGGEVGTVGELYSHTPKFAKSEEVLVFLKKNSKGTGYSIINGSEGKITLSKEEKNMEQISGSNEQINSLKEQIKSSLKNQ